MELPKEINPRLGVFVFLFFLLYIGIFQSWLIFLPSSIIFPHHEIKANVTPNVTIIYKTIIKTVTPTPDGHTYFAGEYQNGTRLLQRPFSFIRNDALYKMDMKVTTIVYDYMMFDELNWFNPTTYKYQEMRPNYTSEGKKTKFLLIFIYCFMDDITGDDTRMWSFNRSFFAVYDGKDTYRPIEYPYQLRFHELENTPTFNKDTYVQGFKSLRMYANTEENRKTAGEYNDEIYYLRGGKSNAIDGYLIFEIPEKDTPEDLLVLAQFYVFGNSQWRLRA
jgi:hypothetical protein